MLRLRTYSTLIGGKVCSVRTYATASSPHSLLYLEHRNGTIESASLSALTAAQQLGGKVTGFVLGSKSEVPKIVEEAKKLKGLSNIIHSSSDQYADPLPEIISPLFEKILLSGESSYTHVVAAHSSAARSVLPRVAAKLDVPAVSDIISLSHSESDSSTTFTRPIYAGNALQTVRASSKIPIKFFTVRNTAFTAAVSEDGENVQDEAFEAVTVEDAPSTHVSTDITRNDRPELGTASRVVSGGRALKSAATFGEIMYPLADMLGAAVGASRAAVDAGYADNSLQVGQTGKVVAPEMYMAIGISGAIQHLAGMKDSKMIVAINKDADAPIFQVADVGLVADLYKAVPEILEKMK